MGNSGDEGGERRGRRGTARDDDALGRWAGGARDRWLRWLRSGGPAASRGHQRSISPRSISWASSTTIPPTCAPSSAWARGCWALPPRWPILQAAVVIAIAAPTPRRRIDEHARAIGLRAARLVHPWASVGASVVIEEGVVIGAGSRLTTSVVVGRHAHVNVNCTIGHDAVLESFVTVFPGVHVSGGCRVEEGAILGTGCVLLPGVCVGRDAEVGAGAVVVRDVAPGTIVVAPAGRPTLRAAANEGGRNPHDVSKAE